jgi:UDPglucose 6-dehydrogenase/GDP-mannose 6-dehydrogenase
MIKYASNALLATAISFSNELANLCAAISGIDAVDVMEGLHASAYLTAIAPDGRRTKAPITSFLLPGCGFGGSCLPKDVKALITHGADHGAAMSLLRAVIAVNETQRTEVVRILERNFPRLDGLRVAVLGLAFKPDTDDVRESPAFPIIRALLSRNTVVRAWDPVAIPEAKKVLGETVAYARSLRDCVEHADAVVLVTRWKEFDALPALLNESRSPPLLVDGRRQFDRGSVARYTGIGV